MFGQWVREKRIENGWTQRELSAKSGIPQTTISGIETGKAKDCQFRQVVRIAKAFSCKLSEIPLDDD